MDSKLFLNFFRTNRFSRHARCFSFRPRFEVLEDRQLLSITSSIFVIDPSASVIALTGDIGGSTILPQGDGSLSTSFSGSIMADWDLGAATINFDQAGTALIAADSGNWQPLPGGGAGSAPATYGGQITIFVTAKAAIHNMLASGYTDNPVALSGTGPYSFPSTQTLVLTGGTADYNAGFLGSGGGDLTGLSGKNESADAGSFEDLGSGSYRLTEPIHVTLHAVVASLPATLHIDGQIVSTTVLPVVNLTDGSGSGFDYATMAVGGAGPVAIEDPAASITRTPPANLTSLTVTLTNPVDGAAEFLGYDSTVLANSGLSTNGYDPTTGTLTFTGSADPSVYQAVLQTITYEDDSLTPATDDRHIQFVVSDGTNSSVVRTTTVTVSAPAAPPGPSGIVLPEPSPLHKDFVILPETLNRPVLITNAAADDLAITFTAVPAMRKTRPESTASQVLLDELWSR